MLCVYTVITHFEKVTNTWGCHGFDARTASAEGKPSRYNLRGGESQRCWLAETQDKQVDERSRSNSLKKPRGCHGFDVVIGISGLRVRELFSVINGQIKLNDNNVVSMADYRAQRLAA